MKIFMSVLVLTLLAVAGIRSSGKKYSLPAGPTAAAARGADGESEQPCPTPCYIIRRMPYPEKRVRGRAPEEKRILLLDICPEMGERVARPTIGVTVNGKTEYREFDVLKELRDEESAREYAARHGISDVSLR